MKLLNFYITALNRVYKLYWELDQGDSDINIGIYRSESQGNDLSEYEKIDEVSSIDITFYEDDLTDLDDSYREWFYQLTAIDKNTGEETVLTEFAETKYYQIPDKVIKTILRQKELVLKRFVGNPFYYIKRRTWGVHCNLCWDSTLNRATDPNCPVCKGTGWVGGYFKPIKFLANVNASPKWNQVQIFGLWKDGDLMLYTLNYPLLYPQDVVVDNIGNRWKIVQVRSIRKNNFIIEQQAHMTLIQPDDEIYKIELEDFNRQSLNNNKLFKT